MQLAYYKCFSLHKGNSNMQAIMPWSVSPVLVIVSTPSRCRLFSLVYLSVYCLIVPVRLVCSSQLVHLSRAPAFLFSFTSPLGFDLCLFFWTPLPPAWPFCLTSSLPAILYLWNYLLVLTFCLSITILLPTPFGLLINILDSNHLPPVSASGSHLVPLYKQELVWELSISKADISLILYNECIHITRHKA
jgi:hypothetical protein